MTIDVSRRGFLKGSMAAGATALFVGTNAKGVLAASHQEAELNPFVKIDTDGNVTVIIKHFEMGQGTTTGLTTLIAEELDADWSKIQTDFAPANVNLYANLFFKMQGTGGSTAIANSFMQYRQAGATARELLVRAASQKWGVAENLIKVDNGVLSVGNRSAHFGEFVNLASTLQTSPAAKLKTPDQFKLIGKMDLPRKDNTSKTDGTAVFAMDVKLKGMLYAAILRSPKFGGKLASFDASDASQIKGFVDAKALPNKAGVVVYTENTWSAFKARDLIKAQWDFSQAEQRSTSEMVQAQHNMVNSAPQHQVSTVTVQDVKAKLSDAIETIEAEFTFPFLAHAPMEVLNCVIEPTSNGVRYHDGCQFPTSVQMTAAHILGLKPENVEVKTVYAGGSFGRRTSPTSDYHAEAAMAFDLMGRKVPIKMMWAREDDIRGGHYRPMFTHKATVGLDKDGNIAGWDHRLAGKSILKGSAFEAFLVHNGIDETSVEGVKGSLYQIPNMSIGLTDFETPIPVLWWRSVGHTHTAFAMETMMDMVAHKAEKDPVAMRLSMLDKNDVKQKRFAGVIEAVRDASGWKKGDKRGFAAHFSFNTYVAMVADVTVQGNRVHVDRLHIAVDCGVPVNPDVIKAQMEGGAGFGLGAIFRNEITLDNGEIVQENFPDYEPLRINEMPEIHVTIIQSADAPSGVGEPGVPPVGPAVANAIFAQTGKRITDLPMTKSNFEFV